MEELLLGTLEGFSQVLAQGAPPASPGGMAQLWLEGGLLLAAVGGLGGEALEQARGRLRGALDAGLEAAVAAAGAAGGGAAAELAGWAAGAGQPGGRLTLQACRQRLDALLQQAQAEARCSLAPLQQLAVPAR